MARKRGDSSSSDYTVDVVMPAESGEHWPESAAGSELGKLLADKKAREALTYGQKALLKWLERTAPDGGIVNLKRAAEQLDLHRETVGNYKKALVRAGLWRWSTARGGRAPAVRPPSARPVDRLVAATRAVQAPRPVAPALHDEFDAARSIAEVLRPLPDDVRQLALKLAGAALS